MSKECLLCGEKQTRINAILKAYSKDKKFYRKALGISIGLNLLILAFGSKGLTIALEFVKGIIK